MYKLLFENKLKELKELGQYREFVSVNRMKGAYPFASIGPIDSKNKAVVWCSNDYLGMSQNPKVLEAMHTAIEQFGAGSGGSRNIGGTHYLYQLLEASLADWHHKDKSLVFPTGYSANDASLQCLLRLIPDCVVFSDALNHASIINGLRSCRVERHVFNHNDVKHLESLLASKPLNQPKLVVFESVYSMDGDIAPIEQIVTLAKKYNALTFLDEVHAIGMYGHRGAGMAEQKGVSSEVDIIQATLAKGVGVIGGYIASSEVIIDTIRSFASGFIFTTSLPPVIVAACYTSLEHIKQSNKERVVLHEKTGILRKKLSQAGIPVMKQSQTHILPILIGDGIKCKKAAKRLLEKHQIYLQPINSPTVPMGTERFRVNVTPNHSEFQINQLVYSLSEVFDYYEIKHIKNKDYAVI